MSNEKQITKKSQKAPRGSAGFRVIKKRENATEYILESNGLRVIHVASAHNPTVTTNLVYHVGSQHEAYGETGLAHMLEHMLFKPTRKKRLPWKELENKGAELNATTWLDRTLYYFTMPVAYFDALLEVEADRMRNLRITDDEFTPERTNVLSEYEMHFSEPESALDWCVVATAFQAHGYKHDTIGHKHDIESFTTQKLISFYNRYYWPNNATLIVVGDIPSAHVLERVRHHFGKIPGKFDSTMRTETVEPQQEGMRRIELVRTTPLRTMMIAFKAPSFSHPDWMPLSLAIEELTLGETSPLYQRLVETNLATRVQGYTLPTKNPYLATFTINATEKSSYQNIEKIVFEEIEKLAQKNLPSRNLNLLKTHSRAQELMARDGTQRIALQLGEYVASGSFERYFDAIDELMRVDAEAVRTAVRRYLLPERATIGTLVKPIHT